MGQIFAREMWGERDFRSCFRYLRQYALPPSTSIGPYKRDLIEDVYELRSSMPNHLAETHLHLELHLEQLGLCCFLTGWGWMGKNADCKRMPN